MTGPSRIDLVFTRGDTTPFKFQVTAPDGGFLDLSDSKFMLAAYADPDSLNSRFAVLRLPGVAYGQTVEIPLPEHESLAMLPGRFFYLLHRQTHEGKQAVAVGDLTVL